MDQHYIPKTYLNGFLDVNGKIWRRQLHAKFPTRPKSFFPSQVAYTRNFYRLQGLWQDGSSFKDPNFVESVVNAHFENKLSAQIKNLVNFVTIPPLAERIAFSETVLHLKRRNTYFRESVYSEKNLVQIREELRAAMANEDKSVIQMIATLEGISADQVLTVANKLLDQMTSHNHFLKEMHNLSLAKRSDSDEPLRRIHNYLATAQWVILKAPPFSPFVTTDNPGFLIDAQGTLKSMGFEGSFRFYLPLNSESTLLVSKTSSRYSALVDIRGITRELIDEINTASALTAGNYIFGATRSCVDSISTSRKVLSNL